MVAFSPHAPIKFVASRSGHAGQDLSARPGRLFGINSDLGSCGILGAIRISDLRGFAGFWRFLKSLHVWSSFFVFPHASWISNFQAPCEFAVVAGSLAFVMFRTVPKPPAHQKTPPIQKCDKSECVQIGSFAVCDSCERPVHKQCPETRTRHKSRRDPALDISFDLCSCVLLRPPILISPPWSRPPSKLDASPTRVAWLRIMFATA